MSQSNKKHHSRFDLWGLKLSVCPQCNLGLPEEEAVTEGAEECWVSLGHLALRVPWLLGSDGPDLLGSGL